MTVRPITYPSRGRGPDRLRRPSSARPRCCRTGARIATVPLVGNAEVPGRRSGAAHQVLVHDAARRRARVRRPERYGARWHGDGDGRADRATAGTRGGPGRMIITVTLNTAIDKTLSVPNFRLGRRHRTVEQTTMPGGKGVNVARVLKTLGAPVIATGLTGGRDRHADRRPAHPAVGAQRLRAHPRGVAHQHRGDRPDDRRADRDQRARAEGLRAGGRAVRRQAALPRQGREHVRVRRLAPARGRHRHLRAPDPRAAPARRGDRGRHRRRPAAPRGARGAGRGLAERARGRGAGRPRVQRRRGPASSPCARWSSSARARRS